MTTQRDPYGPDGCAQTFRDPDEDGADDAFDCDEDDRVDFADPGGRSALRAATADNPRNLPCPTCHAPNRLTPRDRALGYQCDDCADSAEGFGP